MPSTLKSRRLRRIIGAYTVNRLGTWFGFVALSLAVYDHTHSAVRVAALLVSGQVLPAFAVTAVVARIESSPRRGMLSGLYAFEAIATTGLAVLLWHFWLPAVLLVVALDGTAALAASALLRAEAARTARQQIGFAGHDGGANRSTRAHAHKAERKANAALNIAFSATFTFGPVIGGLVVAGAGGSAALFLDAATFLICGAMLVDLRPHVEADGESMSARMRAAWQHINKVPVLRTLLLVEALALVFFEFSGPIEVVYAKATLHAGARGYGLLLAAWGIGVVMGSVIFARSIHRPLGAMLSAGTLAVGVAYVGFAVAPTLAVACVAALLGGVGNGVQWASLISAVQQLTPQRLHGRLMGWVESLGAVCPALGLSLGGVLVAVSSPRIAFLVAGLGAIATTSMFVRLSRAQIAPDVADEADEITTTTPLLEPTAHEPAAFAQATPIRHRSTEPRPARGRAP